MQTYLVHLYFKNAAHIGAANAGIDIEATQDFIHSDTLWAAIANHWAVLGKAGDISFEDFLNGFGTKSSNGDIQPILEPLFRISSAFPFSTSYWLPKPLSVPPDFSASAAQEMSLGNVKTLKRAKFLPLNTFKDWINLASIKSFVEKHESPQGISSNQLRAHATLDRISMQAQLFHSGITYFENPETTDWPEKKVGLYFLLKCDPKTKVALKRIFEVIQTVGGIGGNRSIGLGALHDFNITEAQSDWEFLKSSDDGKNAYCLLSLCYPHSNEQPDKNTAIAYNPVLRKGWTGSLSVGRQSKRQTVYMFSEGSVFRTNLNGGLANITPTKKWNDLHDVYRYGYAFSVPIKINEQDYESEG